MLLYMRVDISLSIGSDQTSILWSIYLFH